MPADFNPIQGALLPFLSLEWHWDVPCLHFCQKQRFKLCMLCAQRVATDFMMEADPEHPGGFLAPSGGFKGLIHNGCAPPCICFH